MTDFSEAAVWPVDLARCRLWPMEAADGPVLQELFDDVGDFSSVFGERGAADAVSTFLSLPEGLDYDAKLLVGVWTNGVLIGVIDCVMGYPSPVEWTVGMLLIAQRHRRQGIGGSVVHWLETLAAQLGRTRIRYGLRQSNRAGLAFLTHQGYRLRPTATPSPDVVVVEKPL